MSGLVMKPSNFKLEFSTNLDTPDWEEIEGVVSFNPGDDEAAEVDVTSFSSPDDRREYRNGLIDTTQGSFVLNWEIGDEVHNELRALVGDQPVLLRSTYLDDDGDGEEIIRQAIIRGLSRPVEMEGVLQSTLTFRFSGAVTITPLVVT